VTDKDKSIVFAGLGAVLVKREVFEKISQPWFICTQHRIKRDNAGRLGFFASQEQEGGEKLSAGEDTYFYLQVRKEGFKIKSTKKIAKHCYIENTVSPVSNARYQSQHKIIKRDKIDSEFI
jgi:predicted peroxiredoxin